MTFVFDRRPGSGNSTASPPSYEELWVCAGIADPLDVQAVALSLTPPLANTVCGFLYRQDIRVEKVGHKVFNVTVPYGPKQNNSGQWSWRGDTTGGSVHITAGKSSVARYPPSAPDHKGLIGVKKDDVEGVDIVIPAAKLSVEFSHPAGVVTIPFFKFIANITGTVNSAPFLSFEAGEVLFLGARMSDGSEAPAQVEYDFAMSPNLYDQVVGGINVAFKAGWDVAWISYQPAVDDGQPAIQPAAVYVERVYAQVDLALALGFGG